jgi:hypothetical protein
MSSEIKRRQHFFVARKRKTYWADEKSDCHSSLLKNWNFREHRGQDRCLVLSGGGHVTAEYP